MLNLRAHRELWRLHDEQQREQQQCAPPVLVKCENEYERKAVHHQSKEHVSLPKG